MYTNATKFNDPFDCHPNLIDFSNVPPEKCRVWPAGNVEKLHLNRFINYRKDLWICCLSKLYNSLLMWSYYNNHEGVCVGLDMECVAQYMRTYLGMIINIRGGDVQYRNIVDRPDFFRDQENLFSYQVFTKAKAWEHEQEVRLFIYKPSPRIMALLQPPKDNDEYIDYKDCRAFVKIGAECFASIYLGVRIARRDKAEIIRQVRALNSDVRIFQMEINPKAFDFIVREIGV